MNKKSSKNKLNYHCLNENLKKNLTNFLFLKSKIFIFLMTCVLMTLFLLNSALAQNNHLVLLAVSELPNGTVIGSTADLYLQIQDGSGRTFMDTYPVSKFDTQLSTRYAKDVACKFSNIDCSRYDFLYTIRARSSFIGGPSASAAISALTFAKLNNLDVDKNVAVTGTINSGRLIGNVGSIKEKIKVASLQGINKVLIPISELVTLEKQIKENSINEKIILENNSKNANSNVKNSDDEISSDVKNSDDEVSNDVKNSDNEVSSDVKNSDNEITSNDTDNNDDDNNTISDNDKNTISDDEANNCYKEDNCKDNYLEDNIITFGKSLGVEIIGVSDLEDVIFHLTGLDLRKESTEFVANEEYEKIMKSIAENMCKRTHDLLELNSDFGMSHKSDDIYELSSESVSIFENTSKSYLLNFFNIALGHLKNSKNSFELQSYYSTASFCYSANVNLQTIYLTLRNNSYQESIERLNELQKAVKLFKDNINNRNPSTISELQTIIILKQRLDETQNYLDNAFELNYTNTSNIKNDFEIELVNQNLNLVYLEDEIINKIKRNFISSKAWAIERLYTASEWAKFFNVEGQKIAINEIILANSCNAIKEETIMRIQYANLFMPGLDKKLKELDEINTQDSIECISRSSLIKAEINAIITAINLNENMLKEMVLRKLVKASEILNEETESGRFPILGYSYYEYAKSLYQTSPFNALVYAEYSLELSNFDIYLGNQRDLNLRNNRFKIRFNLSSFLISFSLVFMGFLLGIKFSKNYFYTKFNKDKKEIKTYKKKVSKKKCNNKKYTKK